MDFSFTEEQETLRREARSFLEERFPTERVAELADSDEGWDPSSWRELAELGWLGVSVSEDRGGAGLTFLEEAVLLEELGRALYPGPYFSTVALALPALDAEEQAAVAAGEARWSAEIDGLVPDLASVDWVVSDGAAVRAQGQVLPTVDATRRFGRLAPDAERRPLAGALDRPRVLAALAVEAVGIAEKALEIGVEHARTRTQFGRPIGVYQAVSHKLADTYVETELARSLAYWAAWSVAEDDARAAVAAAAAKSFAADAAVAAAERAIQVLGGIGFTWEHILHRYYKRALWIQAFAGSAASLRADVAQAVLEGDEGAELEREAVAAQAG
jgi:alkylation response protein AidB-like acyl-CoA dehydrogenase